MALAAGADGSTQRMKRKLSDADDDDSKMMDAMNPSKRHTESIRPKDSSPGIPFEDLDPRQEGDQSSDSEYDYTFYDEDADPDKKPFVPINENSIKTKYGASIQSSNPKSDDHDDDKNPVDDDHDTSMAPTTPKNTSHASRFTDSVPFQTIGGHVPDTALELNWSDSDECIEEYDSEASLTNQKSKKSKDSDESKKTEKKEVPEETAWFPTQQDALKDVNLSNLQMKHSNAAYNVLFKFNTAWPCLSFDFIEDNLGAVRTTIPFSMYIATGTQANDEHGQSVEHSHIPGTKSHQKRYEREKQNMIQFLKMSEIQKTKYDDDRDDIKEEQDPEYFQINDENPTMQNRDIYVDAIVNRLRTKKIANKHLTAVMLSNGNLEIYDSTEHILSLDGLCTDLSVVTPEKKPCCKSKHEDEGYALDWNPLPNECTLLTGSCAGELRLYSPKQSHFVRTLQFKTLKPSIEDVQWSPVHKDVFVSVGCDKCIRVWDTRNKKKEHVARIQNAHNLDINVCSWNPHSGHDHLLMTGSDDNSFKIWDLRRLRGSGNESGFSKKLKKCAHYFLSSWHVKPITSVEWHPQESSCAIVGSDDNQISIWDFSLEEDTSEPAEGAKLTKGQKVPPQLVFLHGGQEDVKEVHCHPQIPNMCVSTAGSGFHMFQPDNLMESLKNEFANMDLVD